MARTIAVAAVQLAAHSRASFPHAWPRIRSRIESAAAGGARLIVLPEGTLPAYVLGYRPYDESEIESALRECEALARERKVVLVIGVARKEGSHVYNSAMVIDTNGKVAGCADKQFLWHFDRQWFTAGRTIAPVPTELGRIGALVCADGRIPTIASTLADRGAELLVMPTAWVTSGRDPENFENVQADLLARVRAKENGVPFVAANKCGVELRCVAYCGKSQIIDAAGDVIALASQDAEETIAGTIALGPARSARTPGRSGGFAWDTQTRVAVAARAEHPGDAELLRIVEADVLLHAHAEEALTDDDMLDPRRMAKLRISGATMVLWRTSLEACWQLAFARARALELRIYVAVIDAAASRAYAVDPDGALLCGTFGDYELASFTFDPLKTRQTAVAPGTDVLEGLERACEHAT